MSKQLHFITCQPEDCNYWWQVAVQCHNFRKWGYSDKLRVLLYLQNSRLQYGFDDHWKWLEQKFPEVKFFYYPDENNLERTIKLTQYASLQRPYMLSKHFKKYPELQKDAIFYLDADVIFSKPLDIDKYINDDVNYLSYTGRRDIAYNYISYDHFRDKEKNIRDDMWNEYEKNEPIEKLLNYIGISKDILIKNKANTGGAQYLLKNMSPAFWEEVFEACIAIRSFLWKANQKLMIGSSPKEKDDNGWQSWCSDMYAIQWLLWKKEIPSLCPVEMDFLWATDEISKWEKNTIYHDAGATEWNDKTFYKRGQPVAGAGLSYTLTWEHPMLRNPFMDDLSFVDKSLCSSKYVEEIQETKDYLKL